MTDIKLAAVHLLGLTDARWVTTSALEAQDWMDVGFAG